MNIRHFASKHAAGVIEFWEKDPTSAEMLFHIVSTKRLVTIKTNGGRHLCGKWTGQGICQNYVLGFFAIHDRVLPTLEYTPSTSG